MKSGWALKTDKVLYVYNNKYFDLEGLFDYGLWGLFLASFLAATVIPFSSEALLAIVIAGGTDFWTAILVASAGNWLGGMSSYAIGYLGKWVWIERFLRIKQETIQKWHARVYKKGAVFAFFCWLPGVGDVIAVVLGLLKANVAVTAIAMLAGKLARYVFWGWITHMVF